MNREIGTDAHTAMCRPDSWQEAVYHKELKLVYCDDLEGQDRGGWEGGLRGRGYMHTYG